MSVTPEVQAMTDALLADPDIEDAAIEAGVLVELIDKDRMTEALDRIDGWSRGTSDAVALILAAGVVGFKRKAAGA